MRLHKITALMRHELKDFSSSTLSLMPASERLLLLPYDSFMELFGWFAILVGSLIAGCSKQHEVVDWAETPPSAMAGVVETTHAHCYVWDNGSKGKQPSYYRNVAANACQQEKPPELRT
mgnify:CR=1 FL=1